MNVARTHSSWPTCGYDVLMLPQAPWCRQLENLKGISPQLHAENLMCNSSDVSNLLVAAQHTVSYVKVVGQEASPSNCVLLSTSRSAWRNESNGCFWADLDVTQRVLAGHLNSRVKNATPQATAVGSHTMEFSGCLGWCAPDTCLLDHALSVNALSAFRSAVHVQCGPKNSR